MHDFTIVMLFLAALAFGVEMVAHRSVLAAGLLCWVLVYLVPMVVK